MDSCVVVGGGVFLVCLVFLVSVVVVVFVFRFGVVIAIIYSICDLASPFGPMLGPLFEPCLGILTTFCEFSCLNDVFSISVAFSRFR